MTPETWADVANWTLFAVGAAMFFGTGAALLSYRKHGIFPGQELDEDGAPVREPSIRSAYTKIVIGLVVGVYGLAGLTAGQVIGI